MSNLIWTVVAVLVVLWLLGAVARIGGSLIHIVLLVAVVLVIYNLLSSGRAGL